ncbi:MAG: hypothetical protein IJU56_02315, partial [Clostridia bacterium]|nr:hypothetical protein [Clostridia bacterium]
TFSGWTPAVAAITGDTTYTATFTTSPSPAALVIEKINAIGEVELTDECKAKIDEAKAAYQALTVPQRELISEEITNKLDKAEADYTDLARNAFADYQDQQVQTFYQSMSELIGGSDDELSPLVSDYAMAITEVSFDSSKSLAENKAAVDAVVTAKTNDITTKVQEKLSSYKTQKIAEVQALAQEGDELEVLTDIEICVNRIQEATLELNHSLSSAKYYIDSVVEELKTNIADRRVAAFNNYKTQKTSDVQALAQDGDSDASTKIISDAVAAIAALSYDTAKTPAQNKAAVDAAANISLPLEAQRNADALAAAKRTAKSQLLSYKDSHDYRAEQKTELSNAIDNGIAAIDAAADIAAVDAALTDAKAAMDAIKTDEQLTAEELAAAKTDAKAELDAYKNADDYRTAEKEDLANAIAAAKAAIDGAADKAAVKTALTDAKAAIDEIKTDAQLTDEENQAAANEVIALIDAIGDVDATQESIDKVVAADEAFEALNDAQKALVTNAQTLTRAKNVLSFEMAKVATKAIIEGMRSDDDSAEMTKVMDDAIAAIDALQYDDAKTDAENSKTIEDGLYSAIHAVIAQVAAEELAAAKAELGVAVAEGRAFYETIKNNELYAQIADDLDTKLQQAEAVLTSDEATQSEVEAVTEQAVNALAAAKEAKDAADEAAAFAAAQEKLRSNISEAKAFYETIASDKKYAKVADALNTAIERAESAQASEDTAELLAIAEAVTAAVATAQADKAAVDADPVNNVGNSSLYRIIKAIVDFIVNLFTKFLPQALKLK